MSRFTWHRNATLGSAILFFLLPWGCKTGDRVSIVEGPRAVPATDQETADQETYVVYVLEAIGDG